MTNRLPLIVDSSTNSIKELPAGENLNLAGSNFVANTVTANSVATNSFSLNGTNVTATGTELNYLDITTLGTSEASKVVTADSGGKVTLAGTTKIHEIIEKADLDATTSGTISFNVLAYAVQFYTANQAANRTINFRGDGSTTLDSVMAVGESMSVAVLMTQGGTAYYLNTIQIDGSSVTPKWSGGSAPSSGNSSSVDVYIFTIIKTASATYTVLASQTQFA